MDPVVSTSWLYDHLDDPDLVILDASQEKNISNQVPEFTGIQIKGARKFDLDGSFSDKNSDLPHMLPPAEDFQKAARNLGINENSLIVVYDNLGIYNSPRTWWMFKAMGHEDIAVLDGGLPAWKREGYPCEPVGDGPIDPGHFIANFQPDLISSAQQVLENIEHKEAQVLDARSQGRFNGTSPEPRENLKGGHIPDSLNLPFEEVLRDGKFLPKDELQKIFSSLALQNGPLIFSCGSGLTASIILLASELVLDNPKSVYDGSWAEWGQLEDYPREP